MDWSGQVPKLLGLCCLALALSFSDGHVHHDDHHHDDHHHDGHTCVHSQLVEPELRKFMDKVTSIPMEAHRSANDNPQGGPKRKILSDSQEPEPLRVKVDYQIDGLEKDKADFLKKQLIPAMVGVLQRSLKVRKPVKGPLHLPHLCTSAFVRYPQYCLRVQETCGAARHNPEFMADWRTCQGITDSQCTSHRGGPGAKDSDFVLYVTANQQESCLPPYKTVATGGFCLLDIDNWYGLPNRPLAGIANLCPNRISTKPEDFGYMLDTAVHEVLHALLMSRPLMEKFIDKDGNKLEQTVSIKDGRATITSPAVRKHVQETFGCDELDGADLEDEGGSGTAGSHWESRMFMGEIMVGNTLASSRDTLSNITLALAEDSGWYIPSYDNSGVLIEGYKKGCNYVQGDCTKNSPGLEEVFCWDDRPSSEQDNICTPDHKSIGYCRSGMTLMNGCSVISPYQNTDCTNPEHGQSGLSVDMGTRHQTGARCFPMATDRIMRKNRFYQSYIGASAACFATVCREGQAYIQIPATADYETREIACPEGEIVDLALLGVGFSEGKVGPCPSSVSLCASHGCPGDCNGNGQCWYGKCTCHVGFVGEDCKLQACSRNSCPGGMKCNLLLGRCESDEGTYILPKSPTPSAKEPEPETSKHPKTKKATKKDSTGPSSPRPREAPEGSEEPEEPEEPIPQDPSGPYHPPAPTSPEQDGPDEKDESEQLITGKAVWNGYLAGCAVFADINGNLEWDQGEPGVLTTPYGEWNLRAPAGIEIVLDPSSRSSCRDIFTGLRPKWPLRAPWGSSYISPLTNMAVWSERMATVATTLNVAVDNPDVGISFSGDVMIAHGSPGRSNGSGENTMSVGKPERVWVDNLLLSGLDIEQNYILDKDVVQDVSERLDDASERPVVLSVVLANTVTQVASFTTGRTEGLEEESTKVGKVIGDLLVQESFGVDRLTTPQGVLLVVQQSQKGNFGVSKKSQNAVARAIADSNKRAFGASKSSDGVELLEELSRMAQVVQGPFSKLAADLGAEKIDIAVYSQSTTGDALEQHKEGLNYVDIRRVLGLDEDSKSGQKYYSWLDFDHSGPSVFLGVFTILIFLFSMIWCLLAKKKTSDSSMHTNKGDTVVVNPMRNAQRNRS